MNRIGNPHSASVGLVAFAIVSQSVLAFSAEPIEKTSYGQSCLRIEGRLQPKDRSLAAIDKLEAALATAGVQSRWIQVVDDGGSPFVENPYLPTPYSAEVAKANEKLLIHWVDQIHRSGMPVLSWFSLAYCSRANAVHPDWRQESILPWPHAGAQLGPCCINSPYGDALIAYCNWAIERFHLDGVWFDGAFLTSVWERPLALTCRCAACQKKFKAETGLVIPQNVDWANPTFRRWLAWRYETFGKYVGRLAGAIRQAHPHAAVATNHYHRGDAPWYGGVPLDRYAADIITGSEAYTAESLDQTMRLCRAYGRSQSEVWRQFDVGPDPQTGVEHLLEHALVSYAAGGQPSFGYDTFAGHDEHAAAAAAMMTPIMNAIHPYVGGNSLPHCALHVSQQTETFFFGPIQGRGYDKSPYFESLSNWTEGLGMAHMPPDYIFDADFASGPLARYKLLLMPLSMAVSDAQSQTAVEYVRTGGTLLLGPGAGQCDALGLPHSDNPLAKAFGFAFDSPVLPVVATPGAVSMVDAAGRQTVVRADRHVALRLVADDWQVLCREGRGDQSRPAVALRPFGQGRVIVMSFDGLDVLGSMPIVGGDAKLEVVADAPASGKYCLKYTDGPQSPQSYCPDLETRVMPFESPEFIGGTLQFDVKVDRSAAVVVEIRSSSASTKPPRLTIEPAGRVQLCGHVVGNIPVDQWIHATLSYDFARHGKPSACSVAFALPEGRKLELSSVSTPTADFRQVERVVVFGPGTLPATFYLDNLEVTARKPDGRQMVVHREDFEAGADSLVSPRRLTLRIAEMLGGLATPPIAIETSPEVRAGVFANSEGRVYVHLHNRAGRRSDWRQPIGPEVVLRGTLPIREAKLAIGGKPLDVKRQNDNWTIVVPPIGLYQVVELKRQTEK